MPAKATLSDTIADTLKAQQPSPDDVAAVIGEAAEELQRLQRERERAHKLSLDPVASVDIVNKARDDSQGHRVRDRTSRRCPRSPEDKARRRC